MGNSYVSCCLVTHEVELLSGTQVTQGYIQRLLVFCENVAYLDIAIRIAVMSANCVKRSSA